ncbi:MAG: hypothetical protein LBB50_00890 [Oscillospiraceae bacterium]|jgi:hypothetical protein|nr:hypothetical protein [Oscillospiraceae bacterium]
MRIITVALLDDESAQIETDHVYQGEHRAVRLEITLPERLREGFSYYTLCFDLMGSGRRLPLGNIYPLEEGDTPPLAYFDNGIIYCDLPDKITSCTFAWVQVEAHRQENGRCVGIEKSVPFVLSFEDAVAGEGDTLSAFALGHMNELMAQLDKLRGTLKTKIGSAQEELAQVLEDLDDRIAQKATAQLAGTQAQLEDAIAQVLATAQTQMANQLAAALAATQAQLTELVEDGIAAALAGAQAQLTELVEGGIGVAHLTAGEETPTLTLLPGIRYYIEFAEGAAAVTLTLDDSQSAADYAQEFMFVISGLTGEDPPQIQIAYQSGAGVDLPENLVWETGYVYELNVLDGLAVSTRWEAVA